ncbi:MAG: ATP-binding protein [Oscillatoriaceae cyanobacterium Prado104]|jgi:signal transduction histidine kinase|nr:ATP-binding protein [Oscillatoriaceae cyanobacterium Prado104]
MTSARVRPQLPARQPSIQTPPNLNEKTNSRRNLLMRLAIAGTTLAVSIAAYASYQVVRNLMLDNLKRNAFLEVQQETGKIDRWLGTRMAEVQTIASTQKVRSLDWAIVKPYLQAETKRIKDFTSFVLAYPDGSLYNSKIDGGNVNIQDRLHFRNAISGKNYISNPIISRVLQAPQIVLATPIWSQDRSNPLPIGVFEGLLAVERVTQVVNELKYGNNSYAFALNSKGEPIFHPNPALMSNVDKPASSLLQSADRDLAAIAQRMVKKEQGIELIPLDGTQKYVAFMPLQEADWSVALVIPRRNIEDQLQLLDPIAIVVVGLAATMILVLWQVQAFEQGELKKSKAASDAAKQELQHTLEELKLAQAQMVQSEKMSSLGQLVAGIAHEINNPVNFIHGNITHAATYTQDLLELIALYQAQYPQPNGELAAKLEDIDLDFLCQDLSKLLASMKLGTERIREIVKSLRLFSRLDEAEVKPVNIHDGIESTLMLLQSRLKAQSFPDGSSESPRAEIQIIKEYGDLPEVECFAGQLNQVFMNILSNAIDALEERARSRSVEEQQKHPCTIYIKTQNTRDGRVAIHIIDNGTGMERNTQQRIFDPFFTTKPIGKGTGMGMSISYQIIVKKHNGTLECFSSPETGTEFAIRIPIQQHRSDRL